MAQLGVNTGTRVTALTRSLLTWKPEDPPALPTALPQIRDLLSAEEAVALGVSRGDGRFGLGLFEISGLDESRAKTIVHRWLAAECGGGNAEPAANTLSPEMFSTQAAREPNTPAIDHLLPQLGLQQQDEIRALICDTPSFVAWIGVFRTSGFTQRERAIFSELIPALRRRFSLERQVGESSLNTAALEAAMDAICSPAFIVYGDDSIKRANAAGRALLELEPKAREWLARSSRQGGDGQFSMTPLMVASPAQHHLAVLRRFPGDPLPRLAVAAVRWKLTKKQTEVLGCIVRGASNKSIASDLRCSEGTVELHVSALLDKAQAEHRSELIAKFWMEL